MTEPRMAISMRGVAAALLAMTPLSGMPQIAIADPSPLAAGDRPHLGRWGVDLAARDTSVRPGDDFQHYASGAWLARTPIPADRTQVGSFAELRDLTAEQLRKLVIQAPKTSQYGALYRSMMDERRVEALGLGPLRADLRKVAAIRSRKAFISYMGALRGEFGSSVVLYDVEPDPAGPINRLNLYQGGLGLPDRDYYLNPEFKPQRDAYRAYMERVFRAIADPAPARAAAQVLSFESAIAQRSWSSEDRRSIEKTNNPMSSAQLAAYAPGFDWNAFFTSAGLPPQQRMIVNENSAIRDIAALVAGTPLATLKRWQAFHTVDDATALLDRSMIDSKFEYLKRINGVEAQRPRWQRAIDTVDGELGDLIGRDYVAHYFPASSKSRMLELVTNLKAAMAERIRGNGWMSQPTKATALEKLSRMDVMVGYPDKFRDYRSLKIRPDDLYGNIKRTSRFNFLYSMEDLGKPVDRSKWFINPQTVDAYNVAVQNVIVFPAGILQAPFFDPLADDAVNYGAIGAVIGHEISHGFDDQGRKFDSAGVVRNWWTPEDSRRFDAQLKLLESQYSKFEPVPGSFINAKLTMGENLADLGGLLIALDAYHRSLNGKPPPVLDGLTGDQRLFLSFAQVWRDKKRPDALRAQLASNPHSPGRFRVLGPLPNIDAWYQAFGVTPDSRMYIPSDRRVRIW